MGSDEDLDDSEVHSDTEEGAVVSVNDESDEEAHAPKRSKSAPEHPKPASIRPTLRGGAEDEDDDFLLIVEDEDGVKSRISTRGCAYDVGESDEESSLGVPVQEDAKAAKQALKQKKEKEKKIEKNKKTAKNDKNNQAMWSANRAAVCGAIKKMLSSPGSR